MRRVHLLLGQYKLDSGSQLMDGSKETSDNGCSRRRGNTEGDPPSGAWVKRTIANHLNQEALREIKQREQSQHLTQYLLDFHRGRFPGKYLDRARASRLSQFAANHFPSRQYMKRFGISETAPHCECGHSQEDRDHLLFEYPRFGTSRRTLMQQLEGPLHSPEYLITLRNSQSSWKPSRGNGTLRAANGGPILTSRLNVIV